MVDQGQGTTGQVIGGFSEVELEAIALNASVDCIDAFVNHAILNVAPPGIEGTSEAGYKSHVHQQLFTILLMDFLARPSPSILNLSGSYPDILAKICSAPRLGDASSGAELARAVDCLCTWLETEVVVDTWLGSHSRQIQLRLTRREFVWIVGNASKHNFSRLDGVSKSLGGIFGRNGLELDPLQALLVLDEFYERFHDDILGYHATALTALVNDVRWGIHEYLQPCYRGSYLPRGGDPPRYSYRYPRGLEHQFAKACFWDLMNDVRSKPFVPKFRVPDYLEGHY